MDIHGGSRNFNILDFSISINPYQPKWKGRLFESCKRFIDKYVYIEWIEDEFKKNFGDDTIITAGITEALHIIGLTLMDNAYVVIPMPSYSYYEKVAYLKAKNIIKIPPKNNIELNFEASLDVCVKLSKVHNRVVLIFGNPTNPSGMYESNLETFLDYLEWYNILVVIDEAFIDFVKTPKSIQRNNVVILKSFTKSYGMPGIRLGYVKTKRFLKIFKKYRALWATGTCGYFLLKEILEDNGKFLRETMPKIWGEYAKFESINMFTSANFGCIDIKNMYDTKSHLRKYNICIRDCSSFGIKNKIRVSIKKPQENDLLLKALLKLKI